MRTARFAVGLLLSGLTFVGTNVARAAQEGPPPSGVKPTIRSITAVQTGVTPRVRDLVLEVKHPNPKVLKEIPFVETPGEDDMGVRKPFGEVTPDGALQTNYPPARANRALTLGANFQGVSQAAQGAVSGFFVSPPDTVGDVGPNHYVQCVNLACQAFNKNGTPAAAVFTLRALFLGSGGTGDCSTLNDGDVAAALPATLTW